jgi:uracil-DNA glycosylase family 4
MQNYSNLDALNEVTIACRKCPRLTAYRQLVAQQKRRAYRDWDYWGKPVPGFGDPAAQVWVVGLAPGAHGSNRTGRNFTGDASGDFLFPALYRAGFASQPKAVSRDDGLTLLNLYISAVCRCVPPDNKPSPIELANCFPYLMEEFRLLHNLRGIVALGRVAFDSILRLYQAQRGSAYRLEFAHNRLYRLENGLPWLLASYHPSRQNTQTGRLTVEMFDAVWQQARALCDGLKP